MIQIFQVIGLMAILMDMWGNQGIYIWANGAKYEGEWKNNKREGKGKMSSSEGKVYEGDFKDNKKDGFGTFVNKIDLP